eukprot:scaffold6123_cov45-Phaeocystis_antarctica.AAC.2
MESFIVAQTAEANFGHHGAGGRPPFPILTTSSHRIRVVHAAGASPPAQVGRRLVVIATNHAHSLPVPADRVHPSLLGLTRPRHH